MHLSSTFLSSGTRFIATAIIGRFHGAKNEITRKWAAETNEGPDSCDSARTLANAVRPV
jgi:hypothetical protein